MGSARFIALTYLCETPLTAPLDLCLQENAVGQPFIVNIVLHCDLRAAGASDDLQQTVRVVICDVIA